MNDSVNKRVADAFTDYLDELVLSNGNPEAYDDLEAETTRRVIDRTKWCGDELHVAAELVMLGVEFGRRTPDVAPDAPPNVKNHPELARALFNACTALTAGTPADGPLPENSELVTRNPNGSFYVKGIVGPLTRTRALHLAVWLIALADPTLSDAVPLLLRVATR